MLIPLHELIEKYKMNINGIVHCGASELQELEAYNQAGIKDIIWIEGQSDLVKEMKLKYPDQIILNHILSDEDNKEVTFNISNNSQSSSILELGDHSRLHPEVHYIESRKETSVSLDYVFELHNMQQDLPKYNMLVLDIQGAELLVLKGANKVLEQVDYVYLEVNFTEVYKGNGLIGEIDEILYHHGFDRKEVKDSRADHDVPSWGDSIYIKN